MRPTKFTRTEIDAILKEKEDGASLTDICCKYGISTATIYMWRRKYGETDPVGARIRDLEAENDKLRKMYVALAMELDSIKNDDTCTCGA